MPTVRNKVVLVTGAGRGIGEATARALAAKGARLVLTDVDEAPLNALVADLGDAAVGAIADVRDLSQMQSAVDAGVERFGGIDIVLANAGISSYGSVLNVDPETFKRVIDINTTGVFHTVRAALPSLIERKGYVLVVSSLAAFTACPGLASYNASKAGAEHFASALRLEVKYQGVDVGSAHMAWIDTPLVQDAKSDLPAFQEMLSGLPWPLNRTLPVEACVDAFVRAVEKRSRRVYVPGIVGGIGWLRSILTTRLGESATLRDVPRLLPAMDAEASALGRFESARNRAVVEKS
ncbi:MAG: SDR family oxidoreductase [Rhodococcus sp. (in: high G+C Gram-positive bacteria)]